MPVANMTSIVGMHRSGTSVTAHLVHELGVSVIGEEKFLRHGNSYNAQGYWETGELVTINNRILYHLGGDWRTISSIKYGWWQGRSLKSLKHRARNFLESVAGSHRAWKDPRLSLTLPLWQHIMAEMGVKTRYIVCLRNPLDVAASLMRRDHMDPATAISLWLHYTYYAIMYTQGQSRLPILYEDLIAEDHSAVLSGLVHFLGCTTTPTPSQSVVQPDLAHGHRHPEGNVTEDDIPMSVRQLWLQLVAWQHGTVTDNVVLESMHTLLSVPHTVLPVNKYKLKGWASDVKMRWLEEW